MNAAQTLKIGMCYDMKKQWVVDGNEPVDWIVYNLLHCRKDNSGGFKFEGYVLVKTRFLLQSGAFV